MGFGNLKTNDGLKTLNEYMADKSYIEGFTPSQADSVVFDALTSAPGIDFAHVLRWYNHIKSYSPSEQTGFPGSKKTLNEYGPRGNEQAKKDDDEDDNDDLFGDDSDEEEETEEEKRIKEERLAKYHAKKAAKTAIVAKSSLLLDIKPWDDTTDMAQLEKEVRKIEKDGLLWGQAKLVPVGYGIKKLQIGAVIEDNKIYTDWLEEEITGIEDLVQSMDIAAFNKI